MNKEEFKEKVFNEFRLEAVKTLTENYKVAEFYNDKIEELTEFEKETGLKFVEIITENLILIHKDLSKINHKIIAMFLYDLWIEHQSIKKELKRLQGIVNDLMENEHRSIRAKVEAVNASLNKIKLEESLKHRFLEFIEKLLNLFTLERTESKTPPAVNITITSDNPVVEVIQADIEKLDKNHSPGHE